jgi:hypothetical protein
MKHFSLIAILIIFSLLTSTVLSQTYYVIPQFLTAESSGHKLFQTPSGITIKTDKDCIIPDRTAARFDTGLYLLIYDKEQAFINDNNEIEYETIEQSCDVLDWMGVAKSSVMVINSNVKYDETHGYLELNNIRVMDGFNDTGIIYAKATLIYQGDNIFKLEDFEQ